jgi:hypothetical protein
MKRYLLITLSLLSALVIHAQEEEDVVTSRPGGGSVALQKIIKEYFRSDPFRNEFSAFLRHLMNDPTIKNKHVYQRTDTSLFYMTGTYTSHNPFFFKPGQVDVILAENAVSYDDSLKVKDTIFAYQIVAYAPRTKEALQEVKKEFDKIHRRYNKNFSSNKYDETKKGDSVSLAAYHYFDKWHLLSPFTLAWGITNAGDIAISISIRIKRRGNEAILPAPLYGF